MLGGAQGARAYQRAEGVSGGEAGVLSKCERKRRTRQRPSLFCYMPPAAPFLPAAEEMGERTPPKTHGLWNSFRPISMRWEKVPQGIDREPTLAAADMVGGGYWRDYRFRRLSNRALAAVSGKCRCGLMGRHFTLVEQSAAVRDVGAAAIRGPQAIRCTPICSNLGLRVVRGHVFPMRSGAQEVLKPAFSSSVFGHFWGCGQK